MSASFAIGGAVGIVVGNIASANGAGCQRRALEVSVAPCRGGVAMAV